MLKLRISTKINTIKDENGRFIGFYSPRYTQVPDDLFDDLMSELSGSELKVLLYVIRRTFGFKRDSDHISLSQMVSGIKKKDGKILDLGTGLTKESVCKAVKSLVEKGILIQNRVFSEENGHEASEYALKIVDAPLSENLTRGLVAKSGQGLVQKPDTQETGKQHTDITFIKNSFKTPRIHRTVDNSLSAERKYLAQQILSICHDRRSLGFYRQVVRLLPKQAVFETLSRVKEAQITGQIRESAGAMFTDLIKRKANELGIEFGHEGREPEPPVEPIRESREPQTPAEIMIDGPMGRRAR